MRLIKYGKITKRHGLSGEVKVLPFSGSFENINNITKFYIEIPSEKKSKVFNIKKVRIQKNTAIVKLVEVDTPEAADYLKNCLVSVNEEELSKLDENEYYWHQLIGLEVYTDNNMYIGKIDDLINNSAQELLVIKNNKKEYLIPFVEKFVLNIDFEESKLIIKPIEGLLD